MNDPSMNMQYGWYAGENGWTTFNEWFSRHLIDPSVRPIADSEAVSPADSKPQGVWHVDEQGDLVQAEGAQIKSAYFTSIAQLLGPDSAFADAFRVGTLTHTFLDVNDFTGIISRSAGPFWSLIRCPAPTRRAASTCGIPRPGAMCRKIPFRGWQMIETRDCVVIDTGEDGLVAVLPSGMSRICSCSWEEDLAVGDRVAKGDPMG